MNKLEISQLPPTVITLAGNWEPVTPEQPDASLLSLETRMRMGGTAIMAEQHPAENMTVVFTGGLLDADGRSEAAAMGNLWNGAFPYLSEKVETLLDGACYDTATSARNTHALLEQSERIADSYTFITSESHLVRATRSFERHGFKGQLVPVAAEDLLFASDSKDDHVAARDYLVSERRQKRRQIEGILRGIQHIDRGDRLIGGLARRARPNR